MDQNFNQQYNQPYMNNGYQPQYGQVKDVFCNILLVILPLRILLAIIMNVMSFAALENVSYSAMMDGSYLDTINTSPGYVVLSMLNYLLLIAYIILVILDIMQVSKAGHKIVGLVLFAIFLNYGYYIWRAYILKRAKTFPIIYTVCYALLAVANVVVTMVYTMNLSMSLMNTMY